MEGKNMTRNRHRATACDAAATASDDEGDDVGDDDIDGTAGDVDDDAGLVEHCRVVADGVIAAVYNDNDDYSFAINNISRYIMY